MGRSGLPFDLTSGGHRWQGRSTDAFTKLLNVCYPRTTPLLCGLDLNIALIHMFTGGSVPQMDATGLLKKPCELVIQYRRYMHDCWVVTIAGSRIQEWLDANPDHMIPIALELSSTGRKTRTWGVLDHRACTDASPFLHQSLPYQAMHTNHVVNESESGPLTISGHFTSLSSPNDVVPLMDDALLGYGSISLLHTCLCTYENCNVNY